MAPLPGVLEQWADRWGLEEDGEAFATQSSMLAPVRYRAAPAMLKVATVEEEVRGGELMAWWNGRGAAPVLEHAGQAILLERACGIRSLSAMATAGDDDEATRILCRSAGLLHAATGTPPLAPTPLAPTPLAEWFRELFLHADTVGGFFARGAAIARELLDDQHEQVVLHGDLHHGNVLDFGAERHPDADGWLAIDPKSLIGDRVFDYANILCNPSETAVMRPGRLERQVDVLTDAAAIDRERLLRWSVAWCVLSMAWIERVPHRRLHACGRPSRRAPPRWLTTPVESDLSASRLPFPPGLNGHSRCGKVTLAARRGCVLGQLPTPARGLRAR